MANFYPAIGINGTIGFLSEDINKLFRTPALTGNFGPYFQWQLLNYGRLKHNVKAQEARFEELVAAYQQTVIRANAEVEDGLAMFLRSQERAALLEKSVMHSKAAFELVNKDYQRGAADFNRVALIQLNLVQQMDQQAQARGEIAQGLIRTYRALGGGWPVGAAPGASLEASAPPLTETKPTAPDPIPAELPELPPIPPQADGAARLDTKAAAPGLASPIVSSASTRAPVVTGGTKGLVPEP